jgi:L-asparaginase II
MRAFPGNGVSKVGAESIQGVGLTEQGIGVCVKILDGAGGSRALGPVCVEVLRQLGIIAKVSNHPGLVPYHETAVTNYRGIVTGRIEVDFALRKV